MPTQPIKGSCLCGAVAFEVERVQREDDGKVAEAEITFIAADVPPMGHTAYAVVPSDEPLPKREIAGGLTIENEFFRITADYSAIVTFT